jgi:hypothetical protein
MKLKKIFMTTLENPLRTKKKKKTEEIIKMHSVFMSTISFFFNVKVVYFSGEIIKLIMFIPTSIKWIDKYNI